MNLDARWAFGGLAPATYRLILADPPWYFRNYSVKGETKNPVSHYACMDGHTIQSLPVGALAHPEGATVVLWATAPMLPQALATLAAWGFTFKSAGSWAKQSSSGKKWHFGTGYVFRSAAEFYLVGTRGRTRQMAHNVRNLIVSPVREHSRKPDAMRRDCEALWPGPRVELFARERAPGWDAWGDQADRFDDSAAQTPRISSSSRRKS